MKDRYHWSVEYFEDLRNVNHTEFVIMEKQAELGKYHLQSQLRTWSELKRQKAEEAAKNTKANPPMPDPQRRNTLSQFLPARKQSVAASPPSQKWGGCAAGCNHNHDRYPRRNQRKPTQPELSLPPPSAVEHIFKSVDSESEDHSVANQEPSPRTGTTDGSADTVSQVSTPDTQIGLPIQPAHAPAQAFLEPGRDGGGTESGAPTPLEGASDESDYFDPSHRLPSNLSKTNLAGSGVKGSSLAKALQNASSPSTADEGAGLRKRRPSRKPTEEDLERWANESGMGLGVKADALGDEPEDGDDDDVDLEAQEQEDKSLRGSVY